MPVEVKKGFSRSHRYRRRCGLLTCLSSMLGLRNSFHRKYNEWYFLLQYDCTNCRALSGKRTPSSSTIPQSNSAPVETNPPNTNDTEMFSSIDRGSPLSSAKQTKVNGDVAKNNTMTSSNITRSESHTMSRTEVERYTVVEDITPILRTKVQRHLGPTTEHDLTKGISIDIFLDYVAAERLRRMPKRGALWDKVLKWAEYFANQVSIYQRCIEGFVPHSTESAQSVWASCRLLLQVRDSDQV